MVAATEPTVSPIASEAPQKNRVEEAQIFRLDDINIP